MVVGIFVDAFSIEMPFKNVLYSLAILLRTMRLIFRYCHLLEEQQDWGGNV